ncbi:MAG: sigma-70 family RNA polymerase sigma factor [Acidimicrobiia bacterium]|nr:sigma-70 family RNA polymerase sigma factor [Acidimicrobiia bacterium]
MTDQGELCRKLARDLDGAFPDLIAAMQDQIYSGLRRLHRADAEDLTQEVFIRAYRALSGYEPSRIRKLKLRGWLWTIAMNLGRNHARDRARRPTPVRLVDHFSTEDPEPLDSQAWSRRLAALGVHQRRAVVLRHVAGLSYGEIARALERPEGTVKADVHRGIERLRTIMEAER